MAGAFSFFSAVHVSFGPFLEGTSTLTHVLSTFDTITRRHTKNAQAISDLLVKS